MMTVYLDESSNTVLVASQSKLQPVILRHRVLLIWIFRDWYQVPRPTKVSRYPGILALGRDGGLVAPFFLLYINLLLYI